MAGLAYKDFRMAVRGDVVHINYDSNAFQFSTPANFNPELIVAAFQPKEQDNVPAQLPPDAGNYDG